MGRRAAQQHLQQAPPSTRKTPAAPLSPTTAAGTHLVGADQLRQAVGKAGVQLAHAVRIPGAGAHIQQAGARGVRGLHAGPPREPPVDEVMRQQHLRSASAVQCTRGAGRGGAQRAAKSASAGVNPAAAQAGRCAAARGCRQAGGQQQRLPPQIPKPRRLTTPSSRRAKCSGSRRFIHSSLVAARRQAGRKIED